MEHGDLRAEDRTESVHGLRCERNLGNKHNRAAAPLHDDITQEFEVHERLPAPSDAAQQRDLPAAEFLQRSDRGRLRACRRMRLRRWRGAREKRIASYNVAIDSDDTTLKES